VETSISRSSGVVIVLMNPSGLPFLAGKYLIVTSSPALMTDFPSPPLRERVGRAGRHHPLRCRAIRILDRKVHRPVGIRERQL
jgi:hypothetical protein